MNRLLIALLICLGNIAFAQETITSTQVKDYLGKEVYLTGKVVDSKQLMSKADKPVLFLNLDKAYPQNDVVVVIFDSVLAKLKFTEADLQGKTIKVKGTVSIYKEKHQIKLENEANLSIEK